MRQTDVRARSRGMCKFTNYVRGGNKTLSLYGCGQAWRRVGQLAYLILRLKGLVAHGPSWNVDEVGLEMVAGCQRQLEVGEKGGRVHDGSVVSLHCRRKMGCGAERLEQL